MTSSFNARDAGAYDRLMGRWSRRLAVKFLDHAGTAPGEHILEMGCGTGSLTFQIPDHVAHVTAVDFSPIYVAYARSRNISPNITITEGDGSALAFADASFDRALTQLVLQFVPDPVVAVRELARVVRPGGVVAACVWDSYGGNGGQRALWDTAAVLDPEAARRRARAMTRPAAMPGMLPRIFAEAGLKDIDATELPVRMEYSDFHDYWDPIAAGEGSLGDYVSGLSPDARGVLEGYMRDAYLSGGTDGPRSFACVAWSARGVVPA
jgi:SAM-dependent methyltransferase